MVYQRLVLIANEDTDSTVIYSEFLKSCGYRVVTVSGAEEAHRIAAQQQPDVIVTDFVERTPMGWRTPEILKQDRKTADIPLIAVTGWAMPDDRLRAMRSGCDVFLPKPTRPAELAVVIEMTIGPS